MIIGIDIDNTVCDVQPYMLATYNQRCGTNYKLEQITGWVPPFKEASFKSHIKECLLDPRFTANLPAVEGAVEAVRALSQQHFVVFITSRDIENIAVTTQWIHEHFGEYPIIFARKGKEGHRLDVLIDDAPHHVERFDRFAICMDQPWNRHIDPRIPRVRNWSEATDLIGMLV